jgi:hypothetical protein
VGTREVQEYGKGPFWNSIKGRPKLRLKLIIVLGNPRYKLSLQRFEDFCISQVVIATVSFKPNPTPVYINVKYDTKDLVKGKLCPFLDIKTLISGSVLHIITNKNVMRSKKGKKNQHTLQKQSNHQNSAQIWHRCRNYLTGNSK